MKGLLGSESHHENSRSQEIHCVQANLQRNVI